MTRLADLEMRLGIRMDDPDLDPETRQLLTVHLDLRDDIWQLIEQVDHMSQVLEGLSRRLEESRS